jgi:hypothetical protein
MNAPPTPPADLEALKADVLLLSVNEPPSPIAGRLRASIDEITRLRAENAELKALVQREVENARSQIERLRAEAERAETVRRLNASLGRIEGVTDNAG